MGENVKFEVQNMRDEDKTKEQVITELNELRQRIAFFEASEIEHKRTEKKLRQSERELFIGNRIRDIFLTVPDDEMYGEVLQVVLEAMESKYGVFGYIDDDGDLVCPSITRDVWEQCNIPDKSIRFPRETWGDRIWGQAMIEKRSLYSNERMPVPDGHLPILRVLVVPVIHQGEVIGNFQIANKATDYDEKDKKLLEQIADHIAPILHARLQRDYQERVRNHAEKKLRESEEKHTKLVHNIPGMVYEGKRDWSAEIINGCEELCGYTSEELKSNEKNLLNIIHPDDKERIFIEGSELPNQKNNLIQTYRIITKEGDIRWVEDHKSSNFSEDGTFMGIDGVVFDITDRVRVEEQIRASLKEKEALLKEVHHRVKNNMQIINSLLSLQGESIGDEQVLDIFKVSQNRIQSMALVHNRLYQSPNLAKVDFASYIRDLASMLFRSYKTYGRIASSIDVPDVSLSIDNAIPCGLILNELVSNSLKHAFPEGREGEIRITLRPLEGKFELVVSDNGVGIPEDLDIRNTKSLGFRLVTSLVNQLDGEIELSRTEGTEFRITFKGADD